MTMNISDCTQVCSIDNITSIVINLANAFVIQVGAKNYYTHYVSKCHISTHEVWCVCVGDSSTELGL